MNEASWKRLLDKICENNVVPVVGSQLLVRPDGASLQGEVAQRLLQSNGFDQGEPLPRFREMNEAISRLKVKIPLQDLYDSAHEAIRATITSPDFVMPTAVEQLAQIADFKLLVTVTPDDLLATALRQRRALTEIIHSPNLPTSEAKDIPADWQAKAGEAHLLYLFGKARSAPTFAIHDEDVLEYAHNMMTRGSQVPNLFLSELQQRNLLLIGCNFPDWLSRFFLRATNRKRLSENGKRSWLIEPLKPEESLTCFLGNYSTQTEILADASPTAFVAELHRRWMASHGATLASKPDEAVPNRIMFFISYSRRTDRVSAENLLAALEKQGVSANEIWFDKNSIEPGQAFAGRILDGINHCRYFLPLLSRATNDLREGFVFREWRTANERASGFNNASFVLPIIVDDDFDPPKYTAERAKPATAWTGLDFGHAPVGTPDERLNNRLKALVRAARQEA